MPINVFIRQVCCSGTLQAVLQASLINIQRHKTIKAPGSIQSITHSLIIIARVFDIYILLLNKKNHKNKQNCHVRAGGGQKHSLHCFIHIFWVLTPTGPHPPNRESSEPNRFFRNRNFPQNRFLSLALYSPIRCPMHILVLT